MEIGPSEMYRAAAQPGSDSAAVMPPEQESTPMKEPGEAFTRGAEVLKNVGTGARMVFDGTAKELAGAQKLQEQLHCRPVLSAHSAGWRAALLEPGFPSEYEKIFRTDGDVLFLPLKSNVGTFPGISTPLLLGREAGILERTKGSTPDQEYALRVRQTPDGTRTYITDGCSTHIKSYDEKMNRLGDYDLAALSSDYQGVHDFACGPTANYAFILPKQGAENSRDYLATLEPLTNKPLWIRELKLPARKGIFAAPDGTVYATVGRDDKKYLEIFTKNGEQKGMLEIPDYPRDVVFVGRDTMIIADNVAGVKAINPSRLKPGHYSTRWEISDRLYENFQFSRDGKYLYGMDNGWSRNRVAKIDARTGHIEWELKDPDSHLLDFRVIDDELYLFAEGLKPDVAIMKKLDANGKVIWEDSIPASRIERWHGGSITPQGDFVFETREDGCLYFLHPRLESDTEENILQKLRKPDDIMKNFRDVLARRRATPAPQAEGIEDMDSFIVIDGVKMEKRQT